jgi:hypothetical protein
VAAHWVKTTVGEHGELILDYLPFSPGEAVEVLVVSVPLVAATESGGSLRGSVLEYRDPFDPVASDDWEAAG